MRYLTLNPKTWDHFVQLFGPRGACGGCWCMWWRVEKGGRTWEEIKGQRAKAALKRLVEKGAAHGILAFEDDEPVAWCTFGPRSHFPRLDRVRAYQGLDRPEGLWSIPCFFIRRDHRGRGVSRGLLAAALMEMKKAGARVVEGYPVTTTADGRPVNSTFAYTGPLSIFIENGFKVVYEVNPLKPVVRKALHGS